jgi:hypothetical protein
MIADTGSDISLISSDFIPSLPKDIKLRQGKKVKLSQVTASTSIDGYVELPIFFCHCSRTSANGY